MDTRLKLPGGWDARFNDDEQYAVLRKKTVTPGGGKHIRKTYMRYTDDFPFLTRTDRQGNRVNGGVSPIPPRTKDKLVRLCKDRWGD